MLICGNYLKCNVGEDLSPSKDNGIIRTVITEGTGYTSPNDGATCEGESVK